MMAHFTKKAVIFDFGQTLADSARGFRSAEKEAQTRLFSYLGKTSWDDFLSVYRPLRKAFHDHSDFSRKDLWVEVCKRYGAASDQILFEQWESDYWHTVEEHTEFFPEAIPTLEQLATEYRLALITNTQRQNRSGDHRINRFPGLEKVFQEIIVAGAGGIPAKPDPAPFRHCLARLDLTPPEVVYVGDDWRIDICGASKVGIQPIWLKHHSVPRSWPEVETSVPIITSLDRLLDLDTVLSEPNAADCLTELR
jgi:HAD superfamily hydrolase (TIGR01549 family)